MKNLTKNEAIKILEEYISTRLVKLEWFKNIEPYIKEIVFYGSTAKGTNRNNSDLDLLIFIPWKIEKKYTKGEYYYNFKGREINIVIRSIERLRKLSNEENNRKEAEVFRDCELLQEKDSEVRALIKDLKSKNQ